MELLNTKNPQEVVLLGAFFRSTLVVFCFAREDVSLSRCIWTAACPPSDRPGKVGQYNMNNVNYKCLKLTLTSDPNGYSYALAMGKSCSRWNSGWFVRWRNLKKRVMKMIAVVTMNTDRRPASRGSRGELERERGLMSTSKGKGHSSESQLAAGLSSPASLTFISNIELSRDLPVCRPCGASARCRGQRAFCGR